MTALRLLYGVTIFLSSFLLFLIEPIVAKQLLPELGGSAAVWMTCLVFFQVALLFGYLYARWMAIRPGNRGKEYAHIALLAAAILVLTRSGLIHSGLGHVADYPVLTIFGTLTLAIGLPFFLLASTSPLLQVWLAQSERRPIPYRLFALSNVGSLLALILYPLWVEPHVALNRQRSIWLWGFVVYAALSVLLAQKLNSASPAQVREEEARFEEGVPASAMARSLWFLLPMVAAMQLSAVTSHITANIAAIPFLWTLPLAVYLLTFIVAFEAPALYRRGIVMRLLIVMLASLAYTLTKTNMGLPIGISLLFFLIEAFLACLFCHAETYRLRPRRPSEATLFYLLIAGGGAAGTFFIGIACPLLFSANYDLAFAFFATAVLALVVTWAEGWPQRLLWSTGTALLFTLIVMLHTAYGRHTILQERNFYGALRVQLDDAPPQTSPMRTLVNGTIQHGTQIFTPELRRAPTTYYSEDSGIGLAMRECCGTRPRRVGVIGLGVGTMAAYGRPGDRFRFYEINPLVRPIAENLFTYLRDSAAQISFAGGDARISLSHEPPQRFDVLVVDAFTGDAIPLHLLTTEAMQLYRRHLAPGGILAFHVSNRYVNLAPEVAQLATASSMQARSFITADNPSRGEFESQWVLATANAAFFTHPGIALSANPIPPQAGLRAWTDDYSSLLPLFNWLNN
jgi:hypothetical protein